jgi:hypothetical protein
LITSRMRDMDMFNGWPISAVQSMILSTVEWTARFGNDFLSSNLRWSQSLRLWLARNDQTS